MKYKCRYCHEYVETEDLVEFISGKSKVRAHKACREVAVGSFIIPIMRNINK